MLPLRVTVVDDEPPARQRLEDLLERASGVELVGSFGSGREAACAIRREPPDLLFLDVQMPGLSGLELLEEIEGRDMPQVVFVTAYDRYAVQAFELYAVDYLLKPFEDDRFFEALERARERARLERVDRLSLDLVRHLRRGGQPEPEDAATARSVDRIAVRKRGGIVLVPVEAIDYIEADGAYERIHTPEAVHLAREGMANLEERLAPKGFLRIHRSTLVKVGRIAAVEPGAGGAWAVRLKNGTTLRVSRGRVEALRGWLGL